MKLLLRDRFDDDRRRFVRERLGDGWRVEDMDTPDDVQALEEALRDADAVVSMSWRAGFPRPDSLKLIQLPGAGFDRVDFDAVPTGAAVCNVFEHEIGIAEFLLLAMLEWEIRLRDLDAAMRRDLWTGSFVTRSPLHGELFGRTVGFIGYGRIARETAKRLSAFGVQVLACSRTPSSGDAFVEGVAAMDGLHEMLRRCDYVVAACPLTEQTRGIIDARALDALGPGGVVINVARGPVVDEDALWQALVDRRIKGAVIDTWYQYPSQGEETGAPSKHPFASLDNIIMSPHASGWSAGLLDRRWRFITDNLKRLERGEALENVLKAPGRAPVV